MTFWDFAVYCLGVAVSFAGGIACGAQWVRDDLEGRRR
jgi:hypothetical protein